MLQLASKPPMPDRVRIVHGLKAYRNPATGFSHEAVLEQSLGRDDRPFLCCVAGSDRGSYLLVFGWTLSWTGASRARNRAEVVTMTPEERRTLRQALAAKPATRDTLISFW